MRSCLNVRMDRTDSFFIVKANEMSSETERLSEAEVLGQMR